MSIKLKFKIQSWHRTKKSLFKLSILLTGDHVDWYDEHENGDADLQLFVYDEEPIVPEETYDAFAYGHELTNKQLYCFHYQIKHAFTKVRIGGNYYVIYCY